MKSYTGREQLKGWLELLVLALLKKEPTCGYRLRQTAIDQSNHLFAPVFGRIYPLLAELEKAGLLKSRPEPGGTRGQKIYAVTPRGEERLLLLTANWKLFSRSMNRVTGC
jgi:DNA-binding PadR family transcriptional regulator